MSELLPGAILFYHGSNGILDSAVRWWTKGPFCHAGVAVGTYESIEAELSVQRIRFPAPTATWYPANGYDPTRLAEALAWLDKQVGDVYGFADLASAALGQLCRHLPLLMVTPNAFDCSDLATRFLILAGVDLPPEVAMQPSLVSPNSLARALGVGK